MNNTGYLVHLLDVQRGAHHLAGPELTSRQAGLLG